MQRVVLSSFRRTYVNNDPLLVGIKPRFPTKYDFNLDIRNELNTNKFFLSVGVMLVRRAIKADRTANTEAETHYQQLVQQLNQHKLYESEKKSTMQNDQINNTYQKLTDFIDSANSSDQYKKLVTDPKSNFYCPDESVMLAVKSKMLYPDCWFLPMTFSALNKNMLDCANQLVFNFIAPSKTCPIFSLYPNLMLDLPIPKAHDLYEKRKRTKLFLYKSECVADSFKFDASVIADYRWMNMKDLEEHFESSNSKKMGLFLC